MSTSLSKAIVNMVSYSALFPKKTLCRAKAFSGVLSNLPKQKLVIIKVNIFNKNYNKFDNLESFFPKALFLIQNRKKRTSDQISA